jgi:hypothetical protein
VSLGVGKRVIGDESAESSNYAPYFFGGLADLSAPASLREFSKTQNRLGIEATARQAGRRPISF